MGNSVNALRWPPEEASRRHRYCGPPGVRMGELLAPTRSNEVKQWFSGAQVFYTHQARVAIRQACLLMGLGKGDEILAPAYNCGSEISPLLQCGVRVKLYPVDRHGQIVLEGLRKNVTDKTKAIYVTHYFGFPQKFDAVRALCSKKSIFLIEDCALALFSRDGATKLGSLGDVAVFNFPKWLPVPDGGVLVINNPDLAVNGWTMRTPRFRSVFRESLPLLKRTVLDVTADSNMLFSLFWSGLQRPRRSMDEISCSSFPDIPGTYYYDDDLNDRKMSSISQELLKTFNVAKIVERRRHNFRKYLTLLTGSEHISPLFGRLPVGVCPLYFPVLVRCREQVCRTLNELSIEAIAWWAGYHKGFPWAQYPDACFLKDHLMVLPVHQQLHNGHIEFIAQKLWDTVNDQRECVF